MLKENNLLIAEEKELTTVVNTCFVNITESSDLKKVDSSSLSPLDPENRNGILENINIIPMRTKLVKLL